MRIKKVYLTNYRQFKNGEISFGKPSNNDLNIFIAVMGTGKTNILNAINWCLYGSEPYLSLQSQQLPRLNLKTLEGSEDGQEHEIIVEVWAESNSHQLIFNRKEKIACNDHQTICLGVMFEVKVIDQHGNCDIIPTEDSDLYVERFVPTNIREFFFFDGERLDRYFREATGQHIRNAIFKISQVDILDVILEHLQRVIYDYRRDAGKHDPEIEKTSKELESIENALKEVETRIENCNNNVSIAKERIEEFRNNLKGIPDVEELQNEKDKLKSKRIEIEKIIKNKIRGKMDILFEYGKYIYFYPVITNSLNIIRDKRSKKEIPPTQDKGLLERILENQECICKTDLKLNNEAKDAITRLLQNIKISPDVARELQVMELPLESCYEEVNSFNQKTEEITREIQELESRLDEITANVSEIDKKIGGYNVEKIKLWSSELSRFEKIHEESIEEHGYLKREKERLKDERIEKKTQLEKELRREKKSRKLKKLIDFSENALTITSSCKEIIMDSIRNQITEKSQTIFSELMWKKETFKALTIDENYCIHLYHNLGYECLGTISGGEREVLALAFTLALHEISGFNSPIIIDRPLAMVSGDPRKYIAEILLRISSNRQIILLLTPDDYLSIRKVLEANVNKKVALSMRHNEKEVIMEES
ncbi:MAG: AAA family ATPase [Candidatus Thorarchaeota archaeon]